MNRKKCGSLAVINVIKKTSELKIKFKINILARYQQKIFVNLIG